MQGKLSADQVLRVKKLSGYGLNLRQMSRITGHGRGDDQEVRQWANAAATYGRGSHGSHSRYGAAGAADSAADEKGMEGMNYQVILADPAWQYHVYDKSDAAHGAATSHYETMSTREIAALPVGDMAAKDCALFLWVTDPLLPEGLEVMRAWGFRFVTVGFYWVKLNKDGTPWFGLGHYTRGNPEMCLLGLRGRPARLSKSVPKLIMSGRREHSRKPDEQYERIEALYGGPRLELFARYAWPSWDVWGNEIESTVSL